MKKLSNLDKQILMTNQKIFELKNPKQKKARFLWFKLTQLNKYAKRYDIDLYAISYSSKKDYIFHYTDKSGKEKSYSPMLRPSGLWSKELFKHLRESLPKGKIIFFICEPYIEGGRIMRKDFYKEVGPCADADFMILKS